MRSTVVVLLFALALAGCTIEVVAPAETREPGSPPRTVDARVETAAADSQEIDEQTAVAVVDEFWRREFARQGEVYDPPRVAGGYRGSSGPNCAGQPSVPGNAYYCPPGDFIAWDDALMAAGYDQIGDAWVYLVIAHEWAHAVQAQLPDRFVSQRVELQADCLAGASLEGAARLGIVQIEPGDADEIAQTLQAVADDYPWTDESSHGNARQRTAAFQQGVSDGVEGCLRM